MAAFSLRSFPIVATIVTGQVGERKREYVRFREQRRWPDHVLRRCKGSNFRRLPRQKRLLSSGWLVSRCHDSPKIRRSLRGPERGTLTLM
jgi:hypothetical protein